MPGYNGPLPQVVNAGGSGASTLTGVLTGNGTSAFTASAVTQHAVLVGGASNAITSIAPVATGQILVSGGVAADPAFTAFPRISGIGIGASPGATTGVTFDGTNFINNYSTGTWTPTVVGTTTAGTTTYTTQQGYYTKIGNLVWCSLVIVITGATGTGAARFGSLPFTSNNTTGNAEIGAMTISATGWAWGAALTSSSFQIIQNSTNANYIQSGSSVGQANIQMSNAAATFQGTVIYFV